MKTQNEKVAAQHRLKMDKDAGQEEFVYVMMALSKFQQYKFDDPQYHV